MMGYYCLRITCVLRIYVGGILFRLYYLKFSYPKANLLVPWEMPATSTGCRVA